MGKNRALKLDDRGKILKKTKKDSRKSAYWHQDRHQFLKYKCMWCQSWYQGSSINHVVKFLSNFDPFPSVNFAK